MGKDIAIFGVNNRRGDIRVKEIDKLAKEELGKANKIYPLFASDHEGWAVLFEKCIEAKQGMSEIIERDEYGEIFEMFNCIMDDCVDETRKRVENISRYAMYTAVNLIQIIAMCDKFIKSQEMRNEAGENI